MWFLRAPTFIACLTAVAAFKDTSPYILFSTSESQVLENESPHTLRLAADVLQITKEFLSSCPSDVYVIVSQPNLNVVDLSNSGVLPRLQQALSSNFVKARLTVPEVVGEFNPESLQDHLLSQCNAAVVDAEDFDTETSSGSAHSRPIVIRHNFPSLLGAETERKSDLDSNDVLLRALFKKALTNKKYTVIYTTTPVPSESIHESGTYEPTFLEPLHMELKRQSDINISNSNNTVPNDASLFKRYQFFTPGIFMGLFVGFILLSILSVALRAISSLKVSYGAFDKEMGPAVQKKLQ